MDQRIAAMVRNVRTAAGFTQSDLARLLGTTQPAVSRWERGHDEPRISTLAHIARVCGQRLRVEFVDDGVDRAQISQQLALSPEDRLASVVNVNRLVAAATPAD